MSTDSVNPLDSRPRVTLQGDRLMILDLAVQGAALDAARTSTAAGHDLEATVRQLLEIGGAVLLHGSTRGTVDAVAAEVDRLLTALRERSERIEAVRTAQDRAAAKGFAFEELLAPVLDAAYASQADVVTATGGQKGIADDLIGDFVVELNPRDTGGRDRRIVIEAKDRKLSMNKALAELDAAMLNRDAQAGMLIFARVEQAPLAGGPLRVVHGNRIMLVYDKEVQDPLALDVGCQLARTLAIATERDDLILDRGMLSERLAKLVNCIDRARAIQRGISSARRGLDGAEDAYNDMNEDALALLYEIQDRLVE